jgi:hypothetical protein
LVDAKVDVKVDVKVFVVGVMNKDYSGNLFKDMETDTENEHG